MRTVTVTAGETIQLGYQYDNEATQVIFPDTIIEPITTLYGTTGTFAIWYRRSGDALGYPIGYPLISYADDQVTWTLTEADMANPGSSQIQLRYIVSDVCVMSQMFMGNVADSVDIGTDVPAPMEAWADALISAAVSGITDDIKDALLDCFAHVAWINDQGQTYYDALEDALYPPVPVSSVTVTPDTFQISSIGGTQQLTATILPSSAQATVSWSSSNTSVATVSESGLVTSVGDGTATITATADGVTGTAACTVALPTLSSISAVYTQSGTVYDTDSLDSLKSDLVVTATYSDSSTATIPGTDYTLSGTLTEGTSTITVSYGGKTTTFTVTVTHVAYWKALNIADDFVDGAATGSGYNVTFEGYYYANGSRCAWSVLDEVIMETGYSYTLSWNDELTPTGANFGVISRDSSCLTAFENHSNIGSGSDSGWKQSYTLTPSVETVIQIQCNKTKSQLAELSITDIWITKEAV